MKKTFVLVKKAPLAVGLGQPPVDPEPLRIEACHQSSDRYACPEYTYELTTDPGEPIFELDTLEEMLHVLAFDVPYYNSDEKRPSLGGHKPEDLAIAVREVEVKTKPVEGYLLPLVLKKCVVDTHESMYIIVRKLVPDVPRADRYVVTLLDLKQPGSPTVEELRQHVGSLVYFNSQYNRRRLLGVAPAREENQGHGDVEIVCTGDC